MKVTGAAQMPAALLHLDVEELPETGVLGDRADGAELVCS